ncbi:succinyl-CoA:3-ketoacid coenzyme A transferase 2, mitochondrial [Ixodes scapularis]|uniref:succinyl-CoA:3-ketoacid coenzyme A transferase 2, mitochondrial n=1 Tax=Ixodes scapularis TaxID=6945 RepID=UPI001A9DB446|nr:succinyl-CoA:3-ketoacid coenzyme A transferase 2, mitochondrial [Ixodes scapularis]
MSRSTRPIRRLCIYTSADEAVKNIKSGSTVFLGGFGPCGSPEALVSALSKTPVKDLVIISNSCQGRDSGISHLLKTKQVKSVTSSYLGDNDLIRKQYLSGELELEYVPMGSLAEKIRAGGTGIPAFFTPTGYGTPVHMGGVPMRYDGRGGVAAASQPKEHRVINGQNYIMEHAITGDFALVKAWRADKAGNLVFRRAAQNFNPAMCRAAKFTIAEVEELCEIGDIPPDQVHLPGIYVDGLFRGPPASKNLDLVLKTRDAQNATIDDAITRIIRRAALEFQDGMYVNLGVGIPLLAIYYLPKGIRVMLHSENGVLGMGPYPAEDEVDPDVINAGLQTVTALPGASFCSSDDSFGLVRGGHLDLTMLGGMEVSQHGDLANWMIPGKLVKGMGGAMDLVFSRALGTKVVVTMQHVTKKGKPKIVEKCRLPLTGLRCVDLIITDMCVFEVNEDQGLTLVEITEGLAVEDIIRSTACDFKVSPELKQMQQADML